MLRHLRIDECPSHLTASADGKLLATIKRHRVINLLDLQHREPAPVVRTEFSLTSAWGTSPNGHWLVTAAWSGSFILWDLVNGVPIESWLPAEEWTWSKANLPEDSFCEPESIERFVSNSAITNASDLIAIADHQPQIKLLDQSDRRLKLAQQVILDFLGNFKDSHSLQ